MTASPRSHDQTPPDSRPRGRAWPGPARWATRLVAGLVLIQLCGCAARLWPPSEWSLSVDLPFVQPAAAPAPTPQPAPAPSGPLKTPTSVAEALAYAKALCALSPAELGVEIERLQTVQAQEGDNPLHAQQLAFAQQLAQLYAEQERLQESNERQAQLLRERQRRIEQLNGQIEAMRAVEYSLPAASPSAVTTPATTTTPVAPFPALPPASAGRRPGGPVGPSATHRGAPVATPPTLPASRAPAADLGDKNNGEAADEAGGSGEPEPQLGEDAAAPPKL